MWKGGGRPGSWNTFKQLFVAEVVIVVVAQLLTVADAALCVTNSYPAWSISYVSEELNDAPFQKFPPIFLFAVLVSNEFFFVFLCFLRRSLTFQIILVPAFMSLLRHSHCWRSNNSSRNEWTVSSKFRRNEATSLHSCQLICDAATHNSSHYCLQLY